VDEAVVSCVSTKNIFFSNLADAPISSTPSIEKFLTVLND